MDSHLSAVWSLGEASTEARWRRALAHVQAMVSDGPALRSDLDVTIHFHPDRPVEGVPLLRHLAADGLYRSQFETGTSNGGLTARPGGDRWLWEHRMFGGAYDHATPDERPKYGSLNYRRRPAGGSLRFGSSHMKLAAHVLERVTFCYPDSVTQPTAFGTTAHMPLVALAEADRHLDVLDDHIEAHIHGPLTLAEDVAELVLDPSFRDTAIADAAELLPFPVTWHHGFRLHVDELARNEEFRGPETVAVGVEIAQDGWLTPKVIGDASQSGYDPQDLKRVWHHVARYGHEWPAARAPKRGTARKSAVEDSIVRAMGDLVAERGYASVTLDQVVARAGTNKPAFYRRFKHLAEVVPQILISRHGTDEDIDTGTLVGDLIEVQRRQRRLFTDPVVTRGFAGWLSHIDATPEIGAPFFRDYLAPRRAYTQIILNRAAERSEVTVAADSAWIADLLTGPLIMRAVMPGLPPVDDRLVAQTIHAALDALGYQGDRQTISSTGIT